MAARVTATDVKAIMPEVDILDATVELYIVAGTALVNSVFGVWTSTESILITEIEKWFVAHMIASTQSRVAIEEKVGDASVKYHDWKGEGLESTPYGQMVLLLDTSGKMKNIGKRAATIYAVKNFDE
jgi:hypothetical protein